MGIARFWGKTKDWINEAREIMDALVSDTSVPVDVRVSRIIHATGLLCGIIAAQPIPFADILILTPIQVLMVYNMAKAMGVPMSESKAKEVITTVLGVSGWGLLAQHGVIGLYKIGLPFLGAVTTIPLVYAATFAIGCAAKAVLEARKQNKELSKELLESIKKHAFEEARRTAAQFTITSMKQQVQDLLRVVEHHKRLVEAREEVSDLRKQLSRLSNRPLRNEEIREAFLLALTQAKNELDIMSPWVTDRVARSLKGLMESALRRGVMIKILYGLHEQSEREQSRRDRTEKAVAMIHSLGSSPTKTGYELPTSVTFTMRAARIVSS